jgi:hypothetical protein
MFCRPVRVLCEQFFSFCEQLPCEQLFMLTSTLLTIARANNCPANNCLRTLVLRTKVLRTDVPAPRKRHLKSVFSLHSFTASVSLRDPLGSRLSKTFPVDRCSSICFLVMNYKFFQAPFLTRVRISSVPQNPSRFLPLVSPLFGIHWNFFKTRFESKISSIYKSEWEKVGPFFHKFKLLKMGSETLHSLKTIYYDMIHMILNGNLYDGC